MTSLIIRNDENQTYNPNVDNYMVLSTNNYANTSVSEIQTLLECINSSHGSLVMVEAQEQGYDMISFLENIGKIAIRNVDRKGIYYYTAIQKTQDSENNN